LLLETLRPERAWWKRVALAGLVVLIITGMLVSGTRSAWLATLVAVVLLILPRLRLRQYIGLATICLLLVGITLSTPGIGEFVSQRATSAVETGGAGRLDIWKVGVGMLDQSP